MLVGANAFAAAAVVAGLSVTPFGKINELLEEKSPWHGYVSDEGYGFKLRAQGISSDCASWSRALVSEEMASDHGGVPAKIVLKDRKPERLSPKSPEKLSEKSSSDWRDQWQKAWQLFSPWSHDELQMIRDCDSSPCRVKINSAEGKLMDKAGEKGRLELFRDLVGERVAHYLKTEERLETEIPGKPIEPWAFLEKRGLKSSELKRPETPSLWARVFREQKDDEVQIRQIIDRRTAIKPDASQAALWIRDVYTDHYFDSWGEYLEVNCKPDGTGVLIQSIILEVDLLKKNDLLTRIARGKIRSSLGDRALTYQEQELKSLLKAMREEREKSVKAAPSKSKG